MSLRQTLLRSSPLATAALAVLAVLPGQARGGGLEALHPLEMADVVLIGIGHGDRTGATLGIGADLDGDGFDELLVGAPGADDGVGRVWVVSGAGLLSSHDVLLDDTVPSISPPAGVTGFGTALRAAGDLDGDGWSDLAVLAAPPLPDAEPANLVLVRGGPDELQLIQVQLAFGHHLGDVEPMGDLDGDGLDELALSCFSLDDGAHVVVIGLPGEFATAEVLPLPELERWRIDLPLQSAAPRLAPAGDLDGDGANDLWLGLHASAESMDPASIALVGFPPEGAGQRSIEEARLAVLPNPGELSGFGTVIRATRTPDGEAGLMAAALGGHGVEFLVYAADDIVNAGGEEAPSPLIASGLDDGVLDGMLLRRLATGHVVVIEPGFAHGAGRVRRFGPEDWGLDGSGAERAIGEAGEELGTGSAFGDLDHDGMPDACLGAPGEGDDIGSVYCISGAASDGHSPPGDEVSPGPDGGTSEGEAASAWDVPALTFAEIPWWWWGDQFGFGHPPYPGNKSDGEVTVTTLDGTTSDGTDVELLLDGAGGAEFVNAGDLRHAVSLDVPAARGGMAPSVAVSFAQGANSATLGRHWTLTQPSSISRRGESGGHPRGNDTDVFWLDGQELVEVHAGPFGSRMFRTRELGPDVYVFHEWSDIWNVHSRGQVSLFGRLENNWGDLIAGMTEAGPSLPHSDWYPMWWMDDPDWESGDPIPLSPPQVQETITQRWWHARTRDDQSVNYILEYHAPTEGPPDGDPSHHGSVLLERISWGQGSLQAPDPAQPSSLRDYSLELTYAPRPAPTAIASAGHTRYLTHRLDEVHLTGGAGGAREQLRTWSFHYQLARPSRQILLHRIEVVGHMVAGVQPDRVTLRRFHYNTQWDEPLQPEDWQGVPIEQVDTLVREPGDTALGSAPGWMPAWELDLPIPTAQYYVHPVARFMNLNHDALPDMLVISPRSIWVDELRPPGTKAPICKESCPDLPDNCAEDSAPYSCHQGGSVCAQAFKAWVVINKGELQFEVDPDASFVVERWLQLQGAPMSTWEDLVARLEFFDRNGDGMDDLLGPHFGLPSPSNSDWRALMPDAALDFGRSYPSSVHAPMVDTGILADIDGDGLLDRLHPPQPILDPWEAQDSQSWSYATGSDLIDGYLDVSGLCLVPPLKTEAGHPAFEVQFGTLHGSWGARVEIDVPFFGGPYTGTITGEAMDLPVGGPYAYTPLGIDCGDRDDLSRPGYLFPSQTLAWYDHREGQPWVAATGWNWLTNHMQFSDKNLDGCADITISVELDPLREIKSAIVLGIEAQVDLEGSTFSEVFYGNCAGDFTPAGEVAQERQAMGAPFTRYREDTQKPIECDELAYNGMELARLCDDPAYLQPWAAPWCQSTPSNYLCCAECGLMFAACDEFDLGDCSAGGGGGGGGADDDDFAPDDDDATEPPAPEDPGGPLDGYYPLGVDNPGTPDDWENNGGEDWDPWLRHRFARGHGVRSYGPSAAATVGGMWADTDRDGSAEWLQVCAKSGYDDPLVTGLPVSPESDAGYPLALHFPPSYEGVGAGPGVSCEQVPGKETSVDFVGGFTKVYPAGERVPEHGFHLGRDHVGQLIDIDGDGFVDYVQGDGQQFTIRLHARQVPELALRAITYPEGDWAPGVDPVDATGTSYLTWRTEDPRDHPLMPSVRTVLSDVVDAAGHRVFQRFGCRVDRFAFAGCQVVASQNHRGALFKQLFSTTREMPGRPWLDAAYTADGQLVDLLLAVPELGGLESDGAVGAGWPDGFGDHEVHAVDFGAPHDGPGFAPSDDSLPGDEHAPDSANPVPDPEPYDGSSPGSISTAPWRWCRVRVPDGAFDGSLRDYVRGCSDFASPHLGGATVDYDAFITAISQIAWSWPYHDGAIGHSPQWPGGVPLHLDEAASPFELFVEEIVREQDYGLVTDHLNHRAASTMDDDVTRAYTLAGGTALDGPKLERTVEEGHGLHAGVWRDEVFGYDGYTVVSSTRYGLGTPVVRTAELDSFGEPHRVTDPDGVVSVVDYDWCGGADSLLAAEGVADSDSVESTYDAMCRVVSEEASSGKAVSFVHDGLGAERFRVTDPKGDQPEMSRWVAQTREAYGSVSAPQRAETDGDSLHLAFVDEVGRVWRERRCQLASPLASGAAAALLLEAGDLACTTGTAVDIERVYTDDGLLWLESAAHPAGTTAPIRWSETLYDSLRRPTLRRSALGTRSEAIAGAAPTRHETVRVAHHDGETTTDASGIETSVTYGPLAAEWSVNSVVQRQTTYRSDGRVIEEVDALGRVLGTQYDALGRPWRFELPPFEGVDASGAVTTLAPIEQLSFTPGGRTDCFTQPDGGGYCEVLDSAGRTVGRTDAVSGDLLWGVTLPTPVPASSPASTTQTLVFERDGATWEIQLDGLGRTVGLSSPDGTSEFTSFDSFGRIASVEGGSGPEKQFSREWLPDGILKWTTTYLVPGGEGTPTTELRFEGPDGRVLRVVDRDGISADYEYDEWGRTTITRGGAADPEDIATWPAGEVLSEQIYDDFDRVVSQCPGGAGSGLACTDIDYDTMGRPWRRTVGSEVWELSFLDDGSLDTANLVGPGLTRTIEAVYDGAGHSREVLVDGGAPGVTRYDVMGRRAHFEPSVADHGPSRWIYDTRGNLLEEHRPGVPPVTYGYTARGYRQWTENGDGMTTAGLPLPADVWTEYDGAGRPVWQTDTGGWTRHWDYADGRLHAAWMENDLGEVVSRREIDWDPISGRTSEIRVAVALDCASAAGAAGTLDACADEDVATTTATWTPAGRRLTVVDAENNTNAWTYDLAPGLRTGRVSTESTDLVERTYEYDLFGRVDAFFEGPADTPHRVVDFEWDDRSRVESIEWTTDDEVEVESYQYDAIGRAVWAGVERGQLSNPGSLQSVEEWFLEYDERDRLVHAGQQLDAPATFVPWDGVCDPGELCFEYDGLGQRTGTTYPDGRAVTMDFADYRLDAVYEGVSATGPPLFEVVQRDALGRPTEILRDGGDIDEVLGRDSAGRVTSRTTTINGSLGGGQGAATVFETMTFDGMGRLIAQDAEQLGEWPLGPVMRTNVYAYNAAGWLVEEQIDDEAFEQTFDRAGNRLSRTSDLDGPVLSATYGLDNRLATIDRGEGDGDFAYLYDDLGRRTNDEDGRSLAFSPRGRLEALLDTKGNKEVSFDYGVGGLRVREIGDEGERTFAYVPGSFEPIVTSTFEGDFNEVRVGGRSVVTLEPMGPAQNLSEGRTPFLRTDPAGGVGGQVRFDAYGNVLAEEGDLPQQSWGGLLASAGVPYLSAGMRDYDPTTGTWLQMDPLGADGDLNAYRYAAGDPVNLSDPSGLCVDLAQRYADFYRWSYNMLKPGPRLLAAADLANNPMPPAPTWKTPLLGDVPCLACQQTADTSSDPEDPEPDPYDPLMGVDNARIMFEKDLGNGWWTVAGTDGEVIANRNGSTDNIPAGYTVDGGSEDRQPDDSQREQAATESHRPSDDIGEKSEHDPSELDSLVDDDPTDSQEDPFGERDGSTVEAPKPDFSDYDVPQMPDDKPAQGPGAGGGGGGGSARPAHPMDPYPAKPLPACAQGGPACDLGETPTTRQLIEKMHELADYFNHEGTGMPRYTGKQLAASTIFAAGAFVRRALADTIWLVAATAGKGPMDGPMRAHAPGPDALEAMAPTIQYWEDEADATIDFGEKITGVRAIEIETTVNIMTTLSIATPIGMETAGIRITANGGRAVGKLRRADELLDADLFRALDDAGALGLRTTGDVGEAVATDWLLSNGYTDIFAVQNASGHGIDIVARSPSGRLSFFEVKTTIGGNGNRVGRLSSRQGDMDYFVDDVLDKAAGGQGHYRSLGADEQARAAGLLDEYRGDPSAVSGSAVGIDLEKRALGVSPWPRTYDPLEW